MRRVVVTGMGGVTSLGQNWETVKAGLLAHRNAVRRMHEWDDIEGLNARLGAPVLDFRLPEHYTRKRIRSMGRVSLLSTRATELALEQAGLIDDPVIKSGRTGIAYGSCTGSTRAVADFGEMIVNRNTRGITATTYVQMMPHTTAVNTGLFFGITGRVIPTPSACTSGSQAIGYAWEAIRHGYQDVMVAGGAEELCPSEVAVFDTLFAASTRNDEPELTPRPFDGNRDGLVIGEGACTLVLEELEHARARGARIHAELVGFATNCDATHITQPNSKTMRICMEEALRTAVRHRLPVRPRHRHLARRLRRVERHGVAIRQQDARLIPQELLRPHARRLRFDRGLACHRDDARRLVQPDHQPHRH